LTAVGRTHCNTARVEFATSICPLNMATDKWLLKAFLFTFGLV